MTMYPIITTKYLAATDTMGARIKATCENCLSITIAYDYGLNTVQNHAKAAQNLADKIGLVEPMKACAYKNMMIFAFSDWIKTEGVA